MSRLATLSKFRASSLVALAEDCNRLVAALREDLSTITRGVMPQWYRVVRSPITPATTPVVQAKFGEMAFIDTTNGDVDFILPVGSERDAFRSVSYVKRVTANSVVIRAVPPNLIHENPTLTLSALSGIAFFTYDGGGNWWWHRG